MSFEDRLRRAIHDRAASVEPDEQAGLDRISDQVFAEGGDMDINFRSPRTRWVLTAAAAALVLIVVGVGVLLTRDGDDDDVDIADDTTTTTERDEQTEPDDTSTTTAPDDSAPGSTTTTPPTGTPAPSPEVQQALWPRPSSDVRFDDPVAAARSFARFYAQFDDPVIGEFRQGDARSGEVPVSSRPDGPETTVLVRQLDGDKWFVIAAVTENITVDQPTIDDTLSCPMATSGSALAFEGTVQVHIDAYRPDGARVDVGQGFVTGSGSPPAGPFSDQIGCSIPSGVEDYAIVRYFTEDMSGELSAPVEMTAFPIRLP